MKKNGSQAVPTRFLDLRFNQRRGNVFGDPCVHSTAQFAVAHTVEEINCQSDPEPDKESDPSHHWQAQHQRDAKDYTKDWENRNKRDTKWAWTLRRDPAKHVHTKTNQDKCKKGPNISQICQIADVRDHCDAANDNPVQIVVI